MLLSLARAIEKKGHSAKVLQSPISPNPFIHASPGFFRNRKELHAEINKIDVLLQINRERPDWLNKNCIHLSWFQDVAPIDGYSVQRYVPEKSLEYFFTPPPERICQAGKDRPLRYLLGGFSDRNQKAQSVKDIDVNLVGYFSELFNFYQNSIATYKNTYLTFLTEVVRKPKNIFSYLLNQPLQNLNKLYGTRLFHECLEIVKADYKPLCGSASDGNLSNMPYIKKQILNYLYVEYPRYADRSILFEKVNNISEKHKCVVAGPNWKKAYPKSPFITDGFVSDKKIFSKSNITIHNNSHGLGLHQRVFDAIDEGSFVLMHNSPRHPGCLENALEPNVHFGLYNADNLTDTIEYWLGNPRKRINGVIEARKIFASDHSWDKRAEQILDDLS
jgi:hypothetical protein